MNRSNKFTNKRNKHEKITVKLIRHSTVNRKFEENSACNSKNISDGNLLPDNNDALFENILMLWLENNRLKIKEQTYCKYKRLISTHIIPELGHIKIPDLTSSVINRFLYEKTLNGRLDKKGGLSSSIVRTISYIINASIKSASNKGFDFYDICGNISKPHIQKKELSVLSVKEQKTLEKYITDNIDNKKIGVLLSLYAGLRIGEVCALKWEDIDLEEKTINVRHTVLRIENQDSQTREKKTRLVLSETKTLSSNRRIPICEPLVNALKTIRKNDELYVLKGNSYPYCDPRSYQYSFHKYLSECGVRNINYHTLRHTFATRCIESGMDIKSLSEILGHANSGITLNIYVHSSLKLKRIQLERMYSLYGDF